MATKPDTIKVSIMGKEEISATHADLYVTVKGSSFVSGNEAMKKAKEVNQLVEALISFGVKNEAVFLQGVHLEQAGGALLKSSSAVYRLKIRCDDLNLFAGMLDVVSSQKNATLERVEWKYNDDEARERVLKLAVEKAKKKAEQVAGALGVKLIGVYDFLEATTDEEMFGGFQPQALRQTSLHEQSLGMDIQHTKNLHVKLEVWYRVSEFQI